MVTTVVRYGLDEGMGVGFEVEALPGFRQAGAEEFVGELREALAPADEGAKAVLEKVREVGPDEVEVKFGIKVSGTMSWLIAKAATEGNFEVTLTRKHGGTE